MAGRRADQTRFISNALTRDQAIDTIWLLMDPHGSIALTRVSSYASRQDASVEHHATALSEIKEQIRRGEYQLDERAVADAILRRHANLPSFARRPTRSLSSWKDHAAIDKIKD